MEGSQVPDSNSPPETNGQAHITGSGTRYRPVPVTHTHITSELPSPAMSEITVASPELGPQALEEPSHQGHPLVDLTADDDTPSAEITASTDTETSEDCSAVNNQVGSTPPTSVSSSSSPAPATAPPSRPRAPSPPGSPPRRSIARRSTRAAKTKATQAIAAHLRNSRSRNRDEDDEDSDDEAYTDAESDADSDAGNSACHDAPSTPATPVPLSARLPPFRVTKSTGSRPVAAGAGHHPSLSALIDQVDSLQGKNDKLRWQKWDLENENTKLKAAIMTMKDRLSCADAMEKQLDHTKRHNKALKKQVRALGGYVMDVDGDGEKTNKDGSDSSDDDDDGDIPMYYPKAAATRSDYHLLAIRERRMQRNQKKKGRLAA